ncbi:MAG: hypothetical protein ACJ8J7_00195 [Sulfurifustaceae bacterium]
MTIAAARNLSRQSKSDEFGAMFRWFVAREDIRRESFSVIEGPVVLELVGTNRTSDVIPERTRCTGGPIARANSTLAFSGDKFLARV